MKIEIEQYEPNEFGLGALFADMHGDMVKFLTQQNMYRIWVQKEGLWKRDESEQINEIVKMFLSEEVPALVDKIRDEELREEYFKFIKRYNNMASVSSILKCARSRPNIAAAKRDFDIHMNLLNLKNGVLDLDTYELLDHDKKYMMTQIMNVAYNPYAKDRTWNKFLYGLSNKDTDWCKYVTRTIAYMLRGNPTDHCMFIWYGPRARNGKSTFSMALLDFFHDYGTTIPPGTLSENNNRIGGAPSPDLMRLVGERFINVPETNQGVKLNAALIKALTGGDTIAIRDLYSGYQDFVNKGVFVLHTNNLPTIDDNTLFTSGRIVTIPYNYFLENDERDVQMLEKLTTEKAKSSFLNMLIQASKYNAGKSIKENQPRRVILETLKYMGEADVIAWFIRENIIEEHGAWTKTDRIVERYNRWAKKNGLGSITSSALTRAFKRKGYVDHRMGVGVGFKDIKLIK